MKNPEFREYALALNEEEELLPEVLQSLGYQTHMVGKWHLGHYERKFHPVGRGFDSFCGNLGGNLDYFYHNCELVTQENFKFDWYEECVDRRLSSHPSPGDMDSRKFLATLVQRHFSR